MYDVEVNNRTKARHANQLKKRYSQSNHHEGSTHDGLLLAFDIPLPSKGIGRFDGGKGSRAVDQPAQTPKAPQTPEPKDPFWRSFLKVETLMKQLHTYETSRIRPVPPEEKKTLLLEIDALEEELS